MEIIFLFSILVVLTIAFFFLNLKRKKNKEKENEPSIADNECCGAHIICEHNKIAINTEIIYYNDEELDIFKNKKENNYTVHDISMFEDVLYTLKEDEVAGWLRSLQLRNIELPQHLKDEALLVISERGG